MHSSKHVADMCTNMACVDAYLLSIMNTHCVYATIAVVTCTLRQRHTTHLLLSAQIELSLRVHMPLAFVPTMSTCVWVALNGKTCDLQ